MAKLLSKIILETVKEVKVQEKAPKEVEISEEVESGTSSTMDETPVDEEDNTKKAMLRLHQATFAKSDKELTALIQYYGQ